MTRPRKTYIARFPGGHTKTRTSPAPYTHASMRTTSVSGPGAVRIMFHTSEEAAREVAGKRGKVVAVEVEGEAAERACVVCANEPTPGRISERRSDGTMVSGPCYRCAR
jgi:hypothetical protein